MRMDFFELLDGIIRGFIYFFHSLARALIVMARHPVRGPFLLERAYLRGKYSAAPGTLELNLQRAEHRQVGGLAFLFLYFFAQFGLTANAAVEGTGPFVRAIAWAPRLDSDELWPPLLAAIISSIVVHAVLRLLIRRRGLSAGIRYRLVRGAMEYSLGFAMLIALPLMGVLLIVAPGENPTDSQTFAGAVVILCALAPFWAPAAQLQGAGRGASGARCLRMIGMTVALWSLMMAAAAIGVVMLDFIAKARVS